MADMKKSPLSLQMDLSKFTLATEEEKAQQEVMSESTTFFKDGMRKLLKNPLAVGSIIVLVLIITAAVVGPMIIPYGYEEMIQVNGRRDKTAKNLGPMEWSKNEQKAIDSGEKLFPHLLGTDEQCRDYFVRILYGTRVSLFVGFFAAILVLIMADIRKYLGLCRRKSGYDHDADCRYYLFTAGYADGHPAFRRIKGNTDTDYSGNLSG